MRNFARMFRFTWPYRIRFVLSLGCAAIVALLWFTEIGAVYPLLRILFDSQNCQRWLAERIESLEISIRVEEARIDELSGIPATAAAMDGPEFRTHLEETRRQADEAADNLRRLQRDQNDLAMILDRAPARAEALAARLRELTEQDLIAQARFDEVKRALREREAGRIDDWRSRRAQVLDRALADHRWWMDVYRRVQPWVEAYLPDDSFSTLILLLAFVLLGIVIKGVFMFLQESFVAQIMQRSLFDIRNVFFRRTLSLDLASFSDQGSAELMARFTNDLDSVAQGFSTLLSKVVREPLRIATCLSGALYLNWRLTVLALVLVPVSAVTTYRVGKIMKRAVRRSLESMSNIYKLLHETFQGIKIVKAFTTERHERRKFFMETRSLLRKSVRVAMIDALSDPVLEVLALSMVSIALLAGSYLVLNQTTHVPLFGGFRVRLATRVMRIEDLLTLYAMLAGISDPIRKLSNVHAKMQRAAAASDRIFGLMDRRPTVVDAPNAPKLPRHRRSIEFDEVTFRYRDGEPVLNRVSFSVRHGETIALVGANGCGKSTLLNLIPRFWDVESGAIRIDGWDIREVQIRSLRSQIGVVPQETILFDGTLAENIAYGSRHAGREAIESAARRAYAHQFIMALPEGYETRIGQGGIALSGGQRQRIALARAMLRDPAILLLDEATSAVDIQDEALIRKAIEEFSRGRTTFLVSHSLGSLQWADRIALLHAGRVEAIGTDAELRRTSPLYRRLHEIQAQRESA